MSIVSLGVKFANIGEVRSRFFNLQSRLSFNINIRALR